MRRILGFTLILMLGYALAILVAEMPRFGDPNAPAYTHVIPRYLTKNVEETGSLDIVTGIIVDYRAYDTLFETTVLYTAVLGMFVALGLKEEEHGGHNNKNLS